MNFDPNTLDHSVIVSNNKEDQSFLVDEEFNDIEKYARLASSSVIINNISSNVKKIKPVIEKSNFENIVQTHNENMNSVKKSINIKKELEVQEKNKLLKSPLKSAIPKMKPATKSRKYLDAFPEIEMYYNKPDKGKKFKKAFIKNGNDMPSKNFNKKTYILENTSQIDAIFNIFVSSFHNFNEFNEYCNTEDIKKEIFFLTVQQYGISAISLPGYYNNRMLMLLNIAEIKNDIVCCQRNLGSYFIKLMGSVHSIKMTIKCFTCIYDHTSFHNSITPSVQLSREIFENENLLKILFSKNKDLQVCNNCNNQLQVSYEFGKYIAIDIEHQSLQLVINNLQNVLSVQDKKFF